MSLQKILDKFNRYLWFFGFCILAVTIFMVIGWTVESQLNRKIDEEVLEAKNNIEKHLLTMFEDTREIMLSVGKEISKTPPSNLYPIWLLLREVFNHAKSVKRSYTLPEMAWVNPHMFQIVNTRMGILDPPIDLSVRDYSKHVSRQPWHLHFASPGPILPPDEKNNSPLILPFGMGITDKEGSFIGTVVGAFYMQDIFNKINALLQNKLVHFALFLEGDEGIFAQTQGKDFKKEELSSFPFSYIIKLSGTPLTLVTYSDYPTFKREYYRTALPLLFKWFGTVICIATLIYAFCYGIKKQNQHLVIAKIRLGLAIEVAALANAERDRMMKRFREKVEEPFGSLVIYIEILSKYLKDEIDLEISDEKQIQFLEKVKMAVFDLEIITRQALK
ncbi:MAG: hypothetical protein H0T62_12355 [Parachlamydiaceae bacterium]|nr:hypothetical protein [Parachlamydiaceae bacterium]